MGWPVGADGDVFRRLEADGFDFSKSHEIDFQIDFRAWPPSTEVIAAVQGKYPNVRVYAPEAGSCGYLQFSIVELVTYDLVLKVQGDMTTLVAPHGGVCESWSLWSS